MPDFVTKDSGAREEYDSGMKRDTEAGKARFDLLHPEGVPYDEQLLTRWALLMSRGAEKYDARNWEKATGEKELNRARSSAERHLMQWLAGETDEDHAAAVLFNILVVETITYKMNKPITIEEAEGARKLAQGGQVNAQGSGYVYTPGAPPNSIVIHNPPAGPPAAAVAEAQRRQDRMRA